PRQIRRRRRSLRSQRNSPPRASKDSVDLLDHTADLVVGVGRVNLNLALEQLQLVGHERVPFLELSGHGMSFASDGIRAIFFGWRKSHRRSVFQPIENLALNCSVHFFCGWYRHGGVSPDTV